MPEPTRGTSAPVPSGRGSMTDPASAAALEELLVDAEDGTLVRLLALRPDLAHPVPASLGSLAARMATRASASRALATLTAPQLCVIEALVLMGRPVTSAELARSLGLQDEELVPLLAAGRERMLILGEDDALRSAPGVAAAVGPSPLGLGPGLRTIDVNLGDGWPTTAPALTAVMAQAPAPARRLLEALTWGPPAGTLGTTVPEAARWLLDRHVLHRSGATEVVLPREVGIAARGGRLVQRVPLKEPITSAQTRASTVVTAEAARALEEVTWRVERLLREWEREPPAVLRTGGLSAREATRLQVVLGMDEAGVALHTELAAMAGLLGQDHDADGSYWTPTQAADVWLLEEEPRRWAILAAAWARSARTPWLAGTRTERGLVRRMLSPDLHRTWAPRLRRQVLEGVGAWPEHAAPSPAQVHELLSWRTARSAPPLAAVTAVLAEAQALGLLGAGALTPAGRAVLDAREESALTAAALALLPTAIGEVIVQADLTGIVPGRADRSLRHLLEEAAEVEGRGAALTVRFTDSSIARALELGWDGPGLLDRLRSASRTQLPQPLVYLIGDVARRHGRLRVGTASAVLRSDDESGLAALVSDRRLEVLGLRQVAPTVLISAAPAATVAEVLRENGLAAALEGPDGRPVTVNRGRRRTVHPVELEPPREQPGQHLDAVAAMRTGQRTIRQRDHSGAAAVDTLERLRAAVSAGTPIEVAVADAGGATRTRVVQPISLDGGRLRARDHAQEAELTIALHRIASVRPAS